MDSFAFQEYIKNTLIPDLKKSGSDQTAKDFETCLSLIKEPEPGTLAELERAIYNGPLNHTAYEIYKHLQTNHQDYAVNEYQREGDKLHSFYRPIFNRVLGCRAHLRKNCDLCKSRNL